jgi:hypothetical protein
LFPYAVVFVETDITVVKSIPQYPKTESMKINPAPVTGWKTEKQFLIMKKVAQPIG